jgi:PAS domain S-box-containing protein
MSIKRVDAMPDASLVEPTVESALRADNAKLREQLALRDLALDGIQTTFVIVDRTIPEPTILYCNRKAAEMCGLQREEMIGRGLSVLSQYNLSVKPDFQKDHATLSSGQKIAYETEVQRPDGRTYWRGVTIVPVFDSAGTLVRSIATGADITAKREAALRQQQLQDQLVAELKERERLLSELQLAQKLESVGRLAAGISHEINTPIQYIGDCIYFLKSGFNDLLAVLEGRRRLLAAVAHTPDIEAMCGDIAAMDAKYDVEFLRAEIPKAIGRMSEGIARVSDIVGAMKEFARPDSSGENAADIKQAIQSTLIVATQAYSEVARVRTEFAEIPEVVCNIGEINQVLLNLLVNAAQAIKEAGRDLDSGVIDIRTEQVGKHVSIRVSDNGCGIPAENLPKLYDPFFTTRDVGNGMGQGLAIARSIVVDKHRGELSVASTVGQGTEFLVTLPIEGRHGAEV